MKKIKKRVLSILLIMSLILSAFVTADLLYPGPDNLAMAAESSEMGENGYSAGGAALVAGTTYTFGGITWVAAEVGNGYAVLQAATPVDIGMWPRMAMKGTITNAAGETVQCENNLIIDDGADIDGYDISTYSPDMVTLYNNISAAEYDSATYGKGLYLISKAKVGTSDNYKSALKTASSDAENPLAGHATMKKGAWLGTKGTYVDEAWFISQDGTVNKISNTSFCVIAPAFNLDTSKVVLNGTKLNIFESSTGISVSQPIISVQEGQTIDLSTVISDVTYINGTNAGRSAADTITASVGSISGIEWTAPTGINSEQSVALTIRETGSGHNLTTVKTISVVPRPASSISVTKLSSFPDTIIMGDSIDLSSHIVVTGYDSGNQSDGVITAYNLSSSEGSFRDTTYTAGTVDSRKNVTISITPTGNLGSVNYSGKTDTFTIEVVSVKESAAEDDFLNNYGSYQSVIDEINKLQAKIDVWKEEIAALTGLSEEALNDLELVKSELEKKQKELATYAKMYNDLTTQLATLIENTGVDSTGYLAAFKNPGTQEEKIIVYINGVELNATETGNMTGDKKLYTATGDVGNGTHTFIFYVSEDGVHVTSIDGKEQFPELVYSDGIKAMQRRLSAQVTALRQLLSGYENLIPEFKTLLSITEANFDQLSGPEQLKIVYAYVQDNVKEKKDIDAALDSLFSALKMATGDISKHRGGQAAETAADKINSISEMVKQLSDSYNANNAYLRENICDIDVAYGYGCYVKYNEKYVFVIFENGSFVYYIKVDSMRKYLANNGDGTFSELPATDQASLASAYDGVDGSKYLYLTDIVHGYNPYVSNPLPTYKMAMASLISGFISYSEKTAALIDALNAINGKEPGDAGYLSIPTDADADTVNAVLAAALESLREKLNALELQRSVYSTNLAGIAKTLNEYLAEDYSDATSVTAEEAAAILNAARNAMSDLELLRGQMSDVNDALSDLYDALFSAFDDMGIETNKDPVKGRGDETTADKIDSITAMVAQITASYNSLKAEYANLEAKFQKVIDAVYGEDEKTVDQVTAAQIISQINKNKQDAITAAVKKALEDAGNFDEQSTAVQQSIASIIEKILDGATVDTSDLDPALQAQLAAVMAMKDEIDGMHQGSDAYASFLTTLRGALSLDSTADAAAILESIQGLKNQVTTLTSQLSAANNTISKIQTKLATQATGDELVALIGTESGGDTTSAYQSGYNAGYVAATQSLSSNNNNTDSTKVADLITNAYQNGYNAGYVAATQSLSSNNNNADSAQVATLLSQVTSLTKENTSLRSENSTLTAENSTLTAENGTLTAENSTLTAENSTLTAQNSTLTANNETLKGKNDSLAAENSSLSSQNKTLNSQNKKLTSKNNKLSDANAAYSAENASLSSQNETLNLRNANLTTQNDQLSATNDALSKKVSSLTTENASLKRQVSASVSSTNPAGNNSETQKEDEENTPSTSTEPDDAAEEQPALPNPSDGNVVNINSAQMLGTSGYNGKRGIPVAISMPTFDTVFSGNPSVYLIELSNDLTYSGVLETNGGAVFETTNEQKERANKIFAYYANNLEKLAQLGWDELSSISDIDNKVVTIKALASIDIVPSELQKAAIENGASCMVDLSGKVLNDGSMYLVVHESNTRVGMFDVALVEAKNGSIDIELPDLSPISVAEVSISEAISFDNVISSTPSGSHDSAVDAGKNGTLKSIFLILVLLAMVVGGIIFCVFLKKGKLCRKA